MMPRQRGAGGSPSTEIATEHAVLPHAAQRAPAREPSKRESVSFRVPGRPVAYVRMIRGVRQERGKRYLAYRDAVGYRAKEAGAEPWTGEVGVVIQAWVKRRTFDLDNLVKGVLDSLSGVAFADDKQVTKIIADIGLAGMLPEELWVMVTRVPAAPTGSHEEE